MGTSWKVAPLPSQSGLSPGMEDTNNEKYTVAIMNTLFW